MFLLVSCIYFGRKRMGFCTLLDYQGMVLDPWGGCAKIKRSFFENHFDVVFTQNPADTICCTLKIRKENRLFLLFLNLWCCSVVEWKSGSSSYVLFGWCSEIPIFNQGLVEMFQFCIKRDWFRDCECSVDQRADYRILLGLVMVRGCVKISVRICWFPINSINPMCRLCSYVPIRSEWGFSYFIPPLLWTGCWELIKGMWGIETKFPCWLQMTKVVHIAEPSGWF